MKFQKQGLLPAVVGCALAFLPLAGWCQPPADVGAPVPTAAAPPALPNMNLGAAQSSAARDVLKMTAAGVPEDVVRAFVENSSASFNLTTDNIIQMKGAGVSSSVTAAMLNHDAAQRQPGGVPPPPPDQPPLPPQDQMPGAPPDAGYPASGPGYGDAGAYYNQLAPYGNWNYLPGYGYCWQPYSSFWGAYPGWGYPFDWLDTGWWFYGGSWCWFPRFHDRGFGAGHFHGFNFPGRGFGGRGGARFGTAGRAGFNGSQGFRQASAPAANHVNSAWSSARNNSFAMPAAIGGQNHFQTSGHFGGFPQSQVSVHSFGGGGFHGYGGAGWTHYGGGGSWTGGRGGGGGGGGFSGGGHGGGRR